MKDINNKGKVNRFKYMLYFYGLFIVFVFIYKYIIAPELPGLILLAAFAPIFGFMSSIINWPVYIHASEAEGGMVVNSQKLFSKKQDSLLITKFIFDSYFETDHLHIGLNMLDEEEKMKQHKIKVSWMKLKDLRALEDKLREINPLAPTK
ncbi:MAG: hypothetical protein ACJAVN_000737 [Roseivirga sp.]|jgi:hypothetical protein